eukprot:m.77820 g.77820  ORF g.77820 m.77820 type:complete len:226 (-) comp12643_c0_seq2:1309-1986(-)
MAWRGFGAIGPDTRDLGVVNQQRDYGDKSDDMMNTIETPSMLMASDHARRNAANPAAARAQGGSSNQTGSQVAEVFQSMQANALSDEDFAMSQKTKQGQRLTKMREEELKNPKPKPQRKPPTPQPPSRKPVIPRMGPDGGNTQAGLVIPSMHKEYGLPLGWRPKDTDASEESNAATMGDMESTGLVVPSMNSEPGLPLGWSPDKKKELNALESSRAVAECFTGYG